MNYDNKEQIKPKQHGRYNSNVHLMQDPRSADLLANKAKAQKHGSILSVSDQEDATTEATRVSSGQSNDRVLKKNMNNAQYYGQDYRTPQHHSSKVSQLPSIQSKNRLAHGRLASLETPSLYDQYENQNHHQKLYNRRNDS